MAFLSFFETEEIIQITKTYGDDENEWGHPIVTEERVPMQGHVRWGLQSASVSNDYQVLVSGEIIVVFDYNSSAREDSIYEVRGERYKVSGLAAKPFNGIKNSFLSPPVSIKMVRGDFID